MADPDVIRLSLLCPRNCQNQNDMLQIFQKLTPPNCPFRPTRIWSRETRKKRNKCLWCVLYTFVDPQTRCLTGTQARELRTELNKWKPICGEIVDYEFYQNFGTGDQGWVFVWKNLACTHTPKKKYDNTQKGELSAVSMLDRSN